MDYAEILAQTTQLLGEVSEGSSTYAASDLAKAVQWAQEQAAQHLGLTYRELVVPVVGGTDVWGSNTNEVAIPLDTIKVTRAEISDGDAPGYTITISPVSQEITLDGLTHVVLNGSVARFGGFDEDVRLTIPGSFSDGSHFDGQFQDIDNTTSFSYLQSNGHTTTSPINNSFTVELWADETGWASYSSYWTDFHFTGISSETGIIEQSNDSTIVEPTSPYFEIVVTPASSLVQFSGGQVDPPFSLTVNVVRHNGFSEQVDILFPKMLGTWDGWEAYVDGTQVSAEEAKYQNYNYINAPDTFICQFRAATIYGWSLANWTTAIGGVQLVGSSVSFPSVPSNLVTVDTGTV